MGAGLRWVLLARGEREETRRGGWAMRLTRGAESAAEGGIGGSGAEPLGLTTRGSSRDPGDGGLGAWESGAKGGRKAGPMAMGPPPQPARSAGRRGLPVVPGPEWLLASRL